MQISTYKEALEENYCGDESTYWQRDNKTVLCIIDGLGHGKYAKQAAQAAKNYVRLHLNDSMEDVFYRCDLAIRSTRGVAMGLIIIEHLKNTITYAGIGNTRAMLVLENKVCRLSSNYGIVGGGYKKLTPETKDFNGVKMIIMYTDGINEMIDINKYSQDEDLDKMVKSIIKDYGRKNDDKAIIICKTVD